MTTTTTKRRCGGVFAYGQMLLRVSKTFWRFSLSQERSAETMGAEKVEQKVPPGIECGEYIENLSIHVGIQQHQAPKY
jgi:hypothetical protein